VLLAQKHASIDVVKDKINIIELRPVIGLAMHPFMHSKPRDSYKPSILITKKAGYMEESYRNGFSIYFLKIILF
jgi:hypothetical protein